MPTPSSRRDFLRTLPAAGVVLPLAAESVLRGAASAGVTAQLTGEFFEVAVDPATGRLDVRRSGGAPFLTGSVVRAHTADTTRAQDEPGFRHTVDVTRVGTLWGEAGQLVVRSRDPQQVLDLELRVTLPPGRHALLVEASCRNVSPRPLTLKRVEPVCATPQTHGSLQWAGVTRILTNGPMYYDPGSVAAFEQPGDAIRSWWNVGLFRGYDREGLACGYVDNQAAQGRITAQRHHNGAVGLIAESILADGFELAPGRTVMSGRFLLQVAPDPYAALEGYAEAMGALHAARTHSVLNGWCDWFFAFEHITEEEVLRNAAFAARHLKGYGLEYIQIDEGFQRWHGEWEGNDRFPHGMKWLARRIRALGLKPGLWLAPYVISEPTALFRDHPDWLLRHPDDRLKRVGPWPSEDSDWARNERPHRFGLDITHPDAAAWLHDLLDTVANRWGYDMIKIDFVDWSLLSAHRYREAGVSRAAAYRRGFEIMRRAIGPSRHLQDCGPGPITVGLLDSMRIELDQNYGFRRDAWKQYFLNPTSSAPAAAKRYYFHKRTWVNDADHVCLNLLSTTQAQAAASLIALTGGNILSGDRLPDLDPVRLDILRKIMPSAGEAARPIDLFDTDRQTAFALTLRRSWAEWTVVGLFNPDETAPDERVYPLARLGLDPAATYLAYDFWAEQLLPTVREELRLSIPPAGVRLVSLRRLLQTPQIVGTDRHVLQGALELEDVRWDPAARSLSGVSLGPANTAHNLVVHIPERQPWVQGGPFLHHDFPHYTLKMLDEHLLRVRVRFDRGERVAWSVNLDRFLRRG